MSFKDIIQKWFTDELGGSLVLPDGWFGRPYDNQHVIGKITESRDALTIALDHNLLLHFRGLKSVSRHNRDLVFGPFDNLRFEWEPAEGGKKLTKEYQGGEVKIVSAPG
jgi:hypothetical protein